MAARPSRRGLYDRINSRGHPRMSEPLIVRAWQLRDKLTIDDGVFVALAEAAGQPLLTTDLDLARGARELARVDVLTHVEA